MNIHRFLILLIFITILSANSYTQAHQNLAPTSQVPYLNVPLNNDLPTYLEEPRTLEDLLARYGLLRRQEIYAWIQTAIEEKQIIRVFTASSDSSNILIHYQKFDSTIAHQDFKLGFLADPNQDPEIGGLFGYIAQEPQVAPVLDSLIQNCNDANLHHARILRLLKNPQSQKNIFRKYDVRVASTPAQITADIEKFVKASLFLQQYRDYDSRTRQIVDRCMRTVFQMAKAEANYDSLLLVLYEAIENISAKQSSISIPKDIKIQKVKDKIDYFMDRAMTIQHFPFFPNPTSRFALQNFYNILIQLSTDQPKKTETIGKPNRDILLFTLSDILETMRDLPNFPQENIDAKVRIAERYAPLAEWLGLNDIANELREIAFGAQYPGVHQALEQALENVFGMNHDTLQRYLRGQLSERVLNALEPLKGQYQFTIHTRVKSLHSLWEKLQLIAKEEKKETLSPDRIDRIEYYLRGDHKELPEKRKGKRRFIDDILGMQVVFSISASIRTARNLQVAESEILSAISSELTRQGSKIARAVQKELIRHGYQEGKIVPEWPEGESTLKAEIQVLSDKDLAVYRYGDKAHWAYKVNEHRPKNRQYSFDTELLERLQFKFTGNLDTDFNILSHEISKNEIYVAVVSPRDTGPAYLNYLRLPYGSIAADAGFSRSINLLPNNLHYTVASHDTAPIVVNDKLTSIKVLPRSLTHPLSPGDILEFKASTPMLDTTIDQIFRLSRHHRATLYTQVAKQDLDENEIHEAYLQGQEKLSSKMKAILLKLFPYLTLTDIEDLVETAIFDAAEHFRFDTLEELYLMAELIDQNQSQTDQRMIMKIVNQFRLEALNRRDRLENLDLLQEKFGYKNKPVPNDFHLEIFASYILAETIGRLKLDEALEITNLDDDITLWHTIQSLSVDNVYQLCCSIARNTISISDVILKYHQMRSNYVHELSIEFREDKPGLVHSISQILEDAGIPIISSSYMTGQGAVFTIFFLTDFERNEFQTNALLASLRILPDQTKLNFKRKYEDHGIQITIHNLPKARGRDKINPTRYPGLRMNNWIRAITNFADRQNINIRTFSSTSGTFVMDIPGSLSPELFKSLLLAELAEHVQAPGYIDFDSTNEAPASSRRSSFQTTVPVSSLLEVAIFEKPETTLSIAA